MSLWVIATCAAIWTVRMLLQEGLSWLAARYRYSGDRPKWVRWIGALFDGGSFWRLK